MNPYFSLCERLADLQRHDQGNLKFSDTTASSAILPIPDRHRQLANLARELDGRVGIDRDFGCLGIGGL